ncbi:hypothetical protein KJ586_05030, partial [Patescibacteria group bacterium]|nr:hypothetical protein [Patescibacteria group bacterium]
ITVILFYVNSKIGALSPIYPGHQPFLAANVPDTQPCVTICQMIEAYPALIPNLFLFTQSSALRTFFIALVFIPIHRSL